MAKVSPYTLLPDAVMYAQTNLNEEKESSKNFVSGDFEREFRVGMMQKTARRRAGTVALIVAFIVGFLWLLALTVHREVQLSKLRQELDQLSANMIAMEATVKMLKDMKHSSNQDEIPVDDYISKKQEQDYEHDPLDSLTVLEDEDDMTDDDDDDDYDEESGDYYPEYDREMQKISKTKKLKMDELIGSVVTLVKDKADNSAKIREIKRMLNEDPETSDIALASALTSPPAHAPETGDRVKRSMFPDSPLDSVDEFAAPRFISDKAEKRVPKKFTPPSSTEKSMLLQQTASHVSRIARNSDGEQRPFIAAHFHGNTSHLNTKLHDHYKGNGLVRLPHGAHHDVWYPSPWTLASPQRPTLTRAGHIHVQHTGIYLVYAQIYYLDSHDIISWVLQRTNADIEGRETLLQCAQSVHSAEHTDKPNSCFSASAIFLRKGDKLAVRNTGGSRHSLMTPEKSFIGLVQLADGIYPEQEL